MSNCAIMTTQCKCGATNQITTRQFGWRMECCYHNKALHGRGVVRYWRLLVIIVTFLGRVPLLSQLCVHFLYINIRYLKIIAIALVAPTLTIPMVRRYAWNTVVTNGSWSPSFFTQWSLKHEVLIKFEKKLVIWH